jgi:hypothetical protein
MKASILLLAGSVGIALAQPTSSLTERDHVESPLCPWFGDDNPLQPTPACCYNVPWTKERYPYKVCMARKIIPWSPQRYLVGKKFADLYLNKQLRIQIIPPTSRQAARKSTPRPDLCAAPKVSSPTIRKRMSAMIFSVTRRRPLIRGLHSYSYAKRK